MNMRQKLTLGIAAIFIVTLTIVGVTYAYFVTRVTGTFTESVNIKTAEIGSVIYEDGNCTLTTGDVCATNDVVSITNVLPGSVTYKSFRVTNTSTSVNAKAQYTITLESWPTQDEAQFVHGTAGNTITGDNNVCYKSTAVQSTGNTIAGNVESSTATATCFDDDEYNNIYLVLYKVDATHYAKVLDNGVLDKADPSDSDETTLGVSGPIYGTEPNGAAPIKVAAASGIVTTHATQDLGNAGDKIREIAGGNGTSNTDYYVLKIIYNNINANQNIENDAVLSLKVSIK